MNYNEIYPCIALIARGRIGKWWIHKEYKTYRVVTKYYVTDNPRSPSQQANRALMHDGVYNWHYFSDEAKNFYNKMRTSSPMSGYNRYLQLYLNATEPMIVYWDTLEKNNADPARLPAYMESEYFGGVGRIRSQDAYPASPPYGAIRFQPATNKFLGFKKDDGWSALGGGAEAVVDGWTSAGAWTYASANTINVPAGAVARFGIGDRVKFTQTTVKYGVIVAVADELITLAGNDDYAVADATISANYYSHEMSPIGYPNWFNYTPTADGVSAMTFENLVITTAKFNIISGNIFLNMYFYGETKGSGENTVFITYPDGVVVENFLGYRYCGLYDTVSLDGYTYCLNNKVTVKKRDNSAWNIGTSKYITFSNFSPLS